MGDRCLTRDEEDVCIFPFYWSGKIYYSCTTDPGGKWKPWCAIELDAVGAMEGGDWDYCGKERPGDDKRCMKRKNTAQ